MSRDDLLVPNSALVDFGCLDPNHYTFFRSHCQDSSLHSSRRFSIRSVLLHRVGQSATTVLPHLLTSFCVATLDTRMLRTILCALPLIVLKDGCLSTAIITSCNEWATHGSRWNWGAVVPPLLVSVSLSRSWLAVTAVIFFSIFSIISILCVSFVIWVSHGQVTHCLDHIAAIISDNKCYLFRWIFHCDTVKLKKMICLKTRQATINQVSRIDYE